MTDKEKQKFCVSPQLYVIKQLTMLRPFLWLGCVALVTQILNSSKTQQDKWCAQKDNILFNQENQKHF